MLGQCHEITVCRSSIGTDQYRLLYLKDLVVGAGTDSGEILALVDLASGAGSLVKDIVHGSHADWEIEQGSEELADSAYGRSAYQD